MGSAEMKLKAMKPFDQCGNTHCWCAADFHETSICQNPCCFFGRWPFGEKSPRNLLSFKFYLWWLCLAHWEFQGLLCCSFPHPGSIPGGSMMILKMCVWCWWAVCWSCFAPQRTMTLLLLGWQRSLVLEPHCLHGTVGGSDGEQRVCEWPRRIPATWQEL